MEIAIAKANTSLDVNVEGLEPNVLEYVIKYGLTQILNDAHSSVTPASEPDDDARKAKALSLAEKKLAALVAGEVRSHGTRTGDPVMAEAIRLATQIVRNAIKASGKKLGNYSADQIRAAAVKYINSHSELLDAARVNVETNKALAADVEI